MKEPRASASGFNAQSLCCVEKYAPEGRRNVATGGAKPVLRQAQPVVRLPKKNAPEGRRRRGWRGGGDCSFRPPAAPAGAVFVGDAFSTGCARRSTGFAPPVATFRGPAGA